jgi:hypothetical protein
MKITIANYTKEPHPLMRRFRVWLEDSVEPEGGFWWNCVLDQNKCLFDPNYPNEERDTLQWYIDNNYKVEEL